jgi:RNA polymerase sigma factor (sigma-70 family)
MMNISLMQRELSLDDLVGPDGELRMEALLADPKSVNPLQRIQQLEVVRAVRRALVGLDVRERRILENRFGLFDGEEQTLEAIGRGIHVSRERVRQLESQAKYKLRSKLSALRASLP